MAPHSDSEEDSDCLPPELECKIFSAYYYSNETSNTSDSIESADESMDLNVNILEKSSSHESEFEANGRKNLSDMDPHSRSVLEDAIYLTLTGKIPQSVLHKADKRMNKYANRSSVPTKPSVSVIPKNETENNDLILWITGNEDEAPEFMKALPSDPKFWSVDPCDRPYYRGGGGDRPSECSICGQKGHYASDCRRVSEDTQIPI